ncbi:MAG TPA: GIY-YIG nuclease family protein [Phycisphaerae bacterium]|nr:GIY-YIG nuclease family protein [Phycisphaerae bacterium]
MKDVKARKPRQKHRQRHRSGKGALIKGMSRRLPSEILESEVFADHLRKMMRRYAGIYALYRKKRLYYVGLTRNLLGRIKAHVKDRHARKWDSFVIFRIQRVQYLKDIETLITRLVETPGNKWKGKVPRDADLNRTLRQVLAEHEHVIRGIKKALK